MTKELQIHSFNF